MDNDVLVTFASERGSTAEIADAIGATLREAGRSAEVLPVRDARDLTRWNAVVVVSAVYMGRWRPEAVRLLKLHRQALAGRPVWLVQSGPLDRSAEESAIPLPDKVARLADAIGVRGHATFGGKLAADAHGFVASKMVRAGTSGDFRNFEQIRAWALGVARALGDGRAA